MKKVYVGMDLGSKECAAVTRNSKGKIIDSEVFKTSEHNLIVFFESLGGEVHVMFEEGELASWVRGTIKPHVASVTVCDPKRNAWVAKGEQKCDKVDARKLAELLRLGSYAEVWHTDDDRIASFKMVVKHYDETSKRLARAKNQIKSLLRRQGVLTKNQAVYGPAGRIKALEAVEDREVRKVLEENYLLLDYLAAAKDRAERDLKAASKRFDVIRRLMEIPGVGPITAARFVAYVGDPNRFNRKTIIKYSRLSVVDRSSDGSPLGRKRLSREGNPVLKDVSRTAFERALAYRKPNGIKTYYARSLARTRSETSARLNTQRKILILMLAMWRDGTRYSDDLVTKRAFTGA